MPRILHLCLVFLFAIILLSDSHTWATANHFSEGTELRIYSGPGASRAYVGYIRNTLGEYVGDQYSERTILAQEINSDGWQASTGMLVFPGGAATPYQDALHEIGNPLIRSYVEDGGRYLGICAGAYYACDAVQFETWSLLPRDLKFFSGIGQGPTLEKHYDPSSSKSARAAKIYWVGDGPLQGQSLDVFYFGGGHFINAEIYEGIEVLAYYDIDQVEPKYKSGQKDFPAIVKCKVGSGVAILSAVHFEWIPDEQERKDPYLEYIIERIEHPDNQSKLNDLRCALFVELGLTLKSHDSVLVTADSDLLTTESELCCRLSACVPFLTSILKQWLFSLGECFND